MKKTTVTWQSYAIGLGNPSSEDFTGRISLTIPDMTLPLRTLVEKYVRRDDVDYFAGAYTEEPHFEHMDKIDLIEASRQVKQGIEQAQKRNYDIEQRKKQSVPPPVPPPVPPDPSPAPSQVPLDRPGASS